MQSDTHARGRDINGYLPAHLVEGAKWYIEFYSFDPDSDGLRRKRLYVPKITPKTARRTHGKGPRIAPEPVAASAAAMSNRA